MDQSVTENQHQIKIHTFGCKVNTYDSGLIENWLKPLTKQVPQRSIHILNTCAVTEEATTQALRLARKLRRENPSALIVATGCSAQVDSERLAEVAEIDLIVGNSHKSQLLELIRQWSSAGTETVTAADLSPAYSSLNSAFSALNFSEKNEPLRVEQVNNKVIRGNIFKKKDLEMYGGEESRHQRAFLKIQDGCNSFCSFCIIPYARGTSRSIPISELLKRVNDLQEKGYQEVVLTGVHIGDYADGDQRLEDLVESVLRYTNIPRLRLSSLEPSEVSDRLLSLFSSPRLCPHLHLSIQSAHTAVLADMKRSYDTQAVVQCLDKINRLLPYAFVGMDIIAGFPTEDEAAFKETFRVLENSAWTRLHVFPYSVRRGTKAALYPQLPQSMRKERASRLRELSFSRYQSWAKAQIGQIKQGLILNQPNRAISRDYWDIEILQDPSFLKANREYRIRIKNFRTPAHNEVLLQGEVIAHG